MSDFILREAVDEDNEEDNEEGNNFVSTLSDDEFIDDRTEFLDQNPSSYYGLRNVIESYDDIMEDCVSKFNFDQEPHNYVNDENLSEEVFDDFNNFEEKIEKFKKSLVFTKEQDENSFFYSILYAIRYHLTGKLDLVSEDYFTSNNSLQIYEKLFAVKDILKLDLKISSFED